MTLKPYVEKDGRPVFWGYARVSTEEQHYSIPAQVEKIESYYQMKFSQTHRFGGVVCEKVSGKIPLSTRPEGAKLVNNLNEGDVFCVTKLDRGWRSTIHFGASIDWFKWKKVQCVVMDLQLDTSSPMGKFAAMVIACMAEAERERISERTKDVIKHQMKEDTWVPPKAHLRYGFTYLGRTPVTRKARYEPNDLQRTMTKQALKLHLDEENKMSIYAAFQFLARRASPEMVKFYPKNRISCYKWANAELTYQRIEEMTNGGMPLTKPPLWETILKYRVTICSDPAMGKYSARCQPKKKKGERIDVPRIF